MRCTQGLSFARSPPDLIRTDAALASTNLWDRVACVQLQAEVGGFRNAGRLLDVIRTAEDWHLRDCAVDLFAFAAPSGLLGQLATVFEHPDYDTRLESYSAAGLTGDLALAKALAQRRTQVSGNERDRIMDSLNDILEPETDAPELIDSPLDDAAFVARVDAMIADLRERHGAGAFVLRGEPLNAVGIASTIARTCGERDYEIVGDIPRLLGLLEAMTGVACAGCLDDDCLPVTPVLSATLNRLHLGTVLTRLEPGHRYFFGHKLP